MKLIKTIATTALIAASSATFATTTIFEDFQAGNLTSALEKIFDQPAQASANPAQVPASYSKELVQKSGELDIEAFKNMFNSASEYLEGITSK